jgi:hypothetical protein
VGGVDGAKAAREDIGERLPARDDWNADDDKISVSLGSTWGEGCCSHWLRSVGDLVFCMGGKAFTVLDPPRLTPGIDELRVAFVFSLAIASTHPTSCACFGANESNPTAAAAALGGV